MKGSKKCKWVTILLPACRRQGLKHKGYNNVTSSNGNSTAQKIGFTGKEHQDELGLGWIDITARNYDTALGRWMNVDPLAEKYYGISSYSYTLNNPVLLIDPDGRDVTITIRDGQIIVSANIYIRGSGANSENAAKIKKGIETYWNNPKNKFKDEKGNKYSVTFDINVQVYNDKTKLKDGDNIIDVKNEEGRSNVSGLRSNRGTWYAKGTKGAIEGLRDIYFKHTAAHEFGHLAGLVDRYSDNWFSGGSTPDEGWENNIMGSFFGRVDQRNIDGIVGGAVKKYNKFKNAYSSYLKNGEQVELPQSRNAIIIKKGIEKRFERYKQTGTFKHTVKPILSRLTGK